MENNTTLLSDKQIVKAKINTAADSFLPPVLYTCSLHAACQTCTNKKKLANLFHRSICLSVPSSFEQRIIYLLVNLERCCSRRGGCWRWSPLSHSHKIHPPWLGLAWLGLAPVPSLLLSFAPVVCSCRLFAVA
jgi:hypothetical protein